MKHLILLSLVLTIGHLQAQNCTLYSGNCKKACELYDANETPQGSHISQAVFDSCIRLCPTFAIVYHEKSVPYLKRGDFYTWRKLMNKAVELESANYLGNRGWCSFQFIRDYEGALKDFMGLDSLTNGNLGVSVDGEYDLKIAMALCKRELGNTKDALKDFDNCITEHENVHHVGLYDYLHRAVTKLNTKDCKGALADLIKQISVYEDLADTYYYIGMAYEQLNEPIKAQENFTIAYAKFTKGHHRHHDYCESLDKVYLSDIEEKLKK